MVRAWLALGHARLGLQLNVAKIQPMLFYRLQEHCLSMFAYLQEEHLSLVHRTRSRQLIISSILYIFSK